jgi:iron complex outermembrane receptor protein
VAATLAAAGSHSTPARAADGAEPTTLEEVTVTAQRREQKALDVPISLTVFSGAAVDQQNFQGVENYFAQTPNVSFTTQGSRDRKVLALRGVSDLLSPDSNIRQGSFAFYIDEFNVAPGTSNPELVDVERIEVLRGPQGTYFGRNAVGGAINITSRQPDAKETYLEGSAQYSSFSTADTHVIANIPLVSDVLALRAVGRYERSDGNIKNINPIGGGNDNTYKYGKLALRFTPNDRLTVDLEGSATDELVGMRDGVPSGVLATFSRTVLYSGAPYNGQAITDGVGFWPDNTDRVNFNRPQGVGTKFWYASNRIRYDADAFSVVNVVGYIHSDEFLRGDIDGGSLDLFYEQESIKRNALSEELRVQSRPGGTVDWTVGAFFSHDTGHTRQFTYCGADNPFGLPDGFQVTSSFSDADAKSYAAFAEGVWHASARTSVTLGGRYTHEKVTNDAYDTSSGTITNFVDAGASFSNFSPRLSVQYKLDDEQNLYGTVSRGFKSGGVQPGSSLASSSYGPETLWNYEAGYKGELLDRRLQLSAALFYMKWHDLQTEFAVGQQLPGGGVQFLTGIANAASARSYGAEIEAAARVVPSVTLSAGVGYNQANFTDYRNAVADGQITDLSGYRLPNAPRWTGHASAEYTYRVADRYDGFARAEWTYKGAIVPDLAAEVHTGFPWQVPSYNFVNLRTGISTRGWEVVAFAENVFDRKYYTNAYEKAFVGGMFLNPSYRNFGVRFTVRTN